MKLASLKYGRDGRLVVVSRDLARCADASTVATTMQDALDTWDTSAPRLKEIANALERGGSSRPFDQTQCASPLPRSHGWADGSAYVNHVELVRRARGAELPASFWTDPLMYRGGSDQFLGPRDPIKVNDIAWGVDLEAEVGAICSDVRMGANIDVAAAAIRLIVILNDVSYRNLIPGELGKGFGFLQGKGQTAFAPVAVTPDELGTAWDGKKLSGPLLSFVNGAPFGKPDAGVDMTFDFPTLVAHAAKTRPLGCGVIIGSGTVSNRDADGGPGKPMAEGGVGYSCIAEVRSVETIREGKPKTPFLNFGDRIRIEMNDAQGRSIFGAIEQDVVRYSN